MKMKLVIWAFYWKKFLKAMKIIIMQICICTAVFLSGSYTHAEDILFGTIVETMNSAGYSYALIENEGQQKWVAVPQVVFAVGDEVEFQSGMDMGQYTSKTLGKTFENIIFSGGVVAIRKSAKEKAELDAQEEKFEIAKADGPDGYTIAELYENKVDLAGKKVEVKGKVYKVSKFMGATWIRLKDGSGSRKKGNHKLIATSQGTAQKDDVVNVSGILAVNKNVGGLSYELIVEQATVKKNE